MNRATRRRQARQSANGKAPSANAGGDPFAPRINAALHHQQSGRLNEAGRIYEQVLNERPDHAAAMHFLGLLHHQAGDRKKGLDLLEKAARLAPDNADFHNNYGTVLRNTGNLEKSVASYRRAIALKPDFAVAFNNLGVAQKGLGLLDEAMDSYREALRLQPRHATARTNLANAEKEAGRLEDAAVHYREALAISPDDAETTYSLGMTLTEDGSIAPALETFRRTVALKPRHADAYLMLASLKRPRERDAEMETMERLYARGDASPSERMLLGFALAKSFEDIGRYDEAFDYLLAGNAARRETYTYSLDTTAGEFAEMKAVFNAAFFEERAGSGQDDETPVFILGMPRSGTTLVEQILAGHPQVAAPGELSALQRVTGNIVASEDGRTLPAAVAGLSREALARAGAAYADLLRAHSADALRITDKMPGNFILIGLIRLLLPRATVLHCVRDAPATCLSIFKTYFRSEGHFYGYNLEELAGYYRLYEDLMAHWHAVLPGFVHDVVYEDLVADQEAQSRTFVEACGLEWDDACLAFHEARRPVRTASAAQVRQPIYTDSLELWRRYGSRLDPLLKGLGR